MSAQLTDLLNRLVEFRDARDWKQFHTVKDLAAAVSIEAAELLELTLWKTNQELEEMLQASELKAKFGKEIADVFLFLLLLCEKLGIDPMLAALDKINENENRYPMHASRGTAKKYTEL